jgi:hypothetical protein
MGLQHHEITGAGVWSARRWRCLAALAMRHHILAVSLFMLNRSDAHVSGSGPSQALERVLARLIRLSMDRGHREDVVGASAARQGKPQYAAGPDRQGANP